jgi:hypothetical protein
MYSVCRCVSVYCRCVSVYCRCVSVYCRCVSVYCRCVSVYCRCVSVYCRCVSVYCRCVSVYCRCVSVYRLFAMFYHLKHWINCITHQTVQSLLIIVRYKCYRMSSSAVATGLSHPGLFHLHCCWLAIFFLVSLNKLCLLKTSFYVLHRSRISAFMTENSAS